MAIDNSWALTSLGREWGLDAFQEHVDILSQSWRCEDLMPNSRAFSLPLTATSILSSRIVSCHSGRTASEPDGWLNPFCPWASGSTAVQGWPVIWNCCSPRPSLRSHPLVQHLSFPLGIHSAYFQSKQPQSAEPTSGHIPFPGRTDGFKDGNATQSRPVI